MRHWRRITQLLVVWTALMVGWLIDYAAGIQAPSTSILWANSVARAVEQIGGIWLVGIVVGSLIWFATRPSVLVPPAAARTDHARTIAALAELRNRGALSPTEYEAKKADLLSRI